MYYVLTVFLLCVNPFTCDVHHGPALEAHSYTTLDDCAKASEDKKYEWKDTPFFIDTECRKVDVPSSLRDS